MRVRTTSTQRTYRYVRLSLVGVIVFLGVGVAVQIATGGPLASVSAAFYTPARDVFVGALCAVSLALLALSGRSIEQVLLDIAAVFAPIVALVPSPVESGDISGVIVACPAETSCVPAGYLPGVDNSLASLLVIGVLGLASAVVLAVVQGTVTRGLVVETAVVAGIISIVAAWWASAPATFYLAAHNVSAVAFFVLIAAVAAVAAFRPTASTASRHRGLRIAYGAIAVGILASLLMVVTIVVCRALGIDLVDASSVPFFFVGEALALALFATFWVVQTIELWGDTDPRALTAGGFRGEADPAPTR